jgi:putative spermidine/putrescine transport system substrate-binding protein
MDVAVINKRSVVKGIAGTAALALGSTFMGRSANAATQITVADPGGPYGGAFRKAFYAPFEAQTGVKVVNVARDTEPVAQFKAMVEAKSYIWDVCVLAGPARETLRSQGLLAPLGFNAADFPDLVKGAVTPEWLGTDVYSTVSAYRTDHFKGNQPKNMTDFWDVKNFPGRRGMYKSPVWTLEQALLADGVAPGDLYPLDIDRAFRKLDQIKPHVAAWWTSGAESAQLIQSGEVDITQIFNARAQAIIENGGPVKINWAQGIYGFEGWAMPKGGPKAEIGIQFIRFCADAQAQATMTETLAYGPTNLKSYSEIPANRAAVLPTFKQNLEVMVACDETWWLQHRGKVDERFSEWILS